MRIKGIEEIGEKRVKGGGGEGKININYIPSSLGIMSLSLGRVRTLIMHPRAHENTAGDEIAKH